MRTRKSCRAPYWPFRYLEKSISGVSQPPHNGTLVLRFALKLHCNHDHPEP